MACNFFVKRNYVKDLASTTMTKCLIIINALRHKASTNVVNMFCACDEKSL